MVIPGFSKRGFTLKTGTIISNGIIIVLLLASTSAVAQILPEDPSRGGQLLVSKGCVKCHAVKGEGGKTGPDLGRINLGDTQLDLAAQIWNHTPSMIAGMEQAGIAKPTLTGQEFTEITNYLYFLRFFDKPGIHRKGKNSFQLSGVRNVTAWTGNAVHLCISISPNSATASRPKSQPVSGITASKCKQRQKRKAFPGLN